MTIVQRFRRRRDPSCDTFETVIQSQSRIWFQFDPGYQEPVRRRFAGSCCGAVDISPIRVSSDSWPCGWLNAGAPQAIFQCDAGEAVQSDWPHRIGFLRMTRPIEVINRFIDEFQTRGDETVAEELWPTISWTIPHIPALAPLATM